MHVDALGHESARELPSVWTDEHGKSQLAYTHGTTSSSSVLPIVLYDYDCDGEAEVFAGAEATVLDRASHALATPPPGTFSRRRCLSFMNHITAASAAALACCLAGAATESLAHADGSCTRASVSIDDRQQKVVVSFDNGWTPT